MTNAPSNSTDKILAMLCHLSYFYFPILFPVIIYLIKKDESPALAEAAKEALNFHISWIVYIVLSFILWLVIIGIFLTWLLAVAGLVLAIVATVKAAEGKPYRYPMTFRLI